MSFEQSGRELDQTLQTQSQTISELQADVRSLAADNDALEERVLVLEGGTTPVPPPPAFQPMDQFLGQVNSPAAMNLLESAGWDWGYHVYANAAEPSVNDWLDAVADKGRRARVSVGPSWFTSPGGEQLNAAGQTGVAALRSHAAIISGVEIDDGMTNYQQANDTLFAALGSDSIMLSGYGDYETRYDQWSRTFYVIYQDGAAIGDRKAVHWDAFDSTWPLRGLQNRNAQRTPDNMPRLGTKTNHCWLQVKGELPQGTWTQADVGSGAGGQALSPFIRPSRTQLHYQLLMAHQVRCNAVSWYTNGNHRYPGQQMSQYDPDLFGDLVHVINAYRNQQIVETWGTYRDRNFPLAAV